LLLRPRRSSFKSNHKKRTPILQLPKTFNKKLKYGQVGIKSLNHPTLIYNKHLFKLKIYLKKSVRKSSITNRGLWLNLFPQIPITKKVIGSRMGKGKGKPSNWAAEISTGLIFLELRNLRLGRANYFLTQTMHKLPGKYEIILKYQTLLPIISFKKKYIYYNYRY